MSIETVTNWAWNRVPSSLKPLADNQLSRVLCGSIFFGGFKYYLHHRWLLKSQWWPMEKIEEHRLTLLKKILKHAYLNVPFYKNSFKKINITPENIKSINDLEKIPIITKEDVLKNYNNLFSKTTKKQHLKTILTGGSTGKPLTVNYDNNFWAHVSATERLIKNIAGFDDFSPRLSLPGNGPFYKRNKDIIEYNPITRQLFLSSVVLSDNVFMDYINAVMKYKPKYLDAHPSITYYFAQFLKKHDITSVNFDSILCSGEILYDFQRNLIEKQFNCKVFNYYGHNEMLCLAAECEKHDGMHITELGLIEILDKDGNQLKPGKTGRIVATTLYNYAWPLIRYDTGDIGKLETKPCSCGRGLVRLKDVQGRCNDMIRLPDGRIIPPNCFTMTMDKFSFAKQFQFVQEDEKTLVLNIIKKNKTNKKEINIIRKYIKNLISNSIKFNIEYVDHIDPKGRKNKYRYVISNVH